MTQNCDDDYPSRQVSTIKVSERPQRIMIVIADLGAGGAQQVATQVGAHWCASGHSVSFATWADPTTDFFTIPSTAERCVLGGVTTSTSVREKITGNIKRIRALRSAIKAYQPDVLLSFIAPTNIISILAAAGLSCRTIISERNDPSRQSFGRIWDLLRRYLYGRADVVTANSQSALTAMASWVPSAKLTLLPNPLRCSKNAPLSIDSRVAREKIFLNVGRLHQQKAQSLLIDAFDQMADRAECADWRLVIAGDGRERAKLEAQCAAAKHGDKIKLLGQIADPFEWYARAGVFVFPSYHEGTPNALMEALSMGCPSIASEHVPAHQDLIDPGRNGMLVPTASGDPSQLSEAMARLAADHDLRAQLSQQAVGAVRDFTPEKVFAVWDMTILR